MQIIHQSMPATKTTTTRTAATTIDCCRRRDDKTFNNLIRACHCTDGFRCDTVSQETTTHCDDTRASLSLTLTVNDKKERADRFFTILLPTASSRYYNLFASDADRLFCSEAEGFCVKDGG
jgi:hypothetical protein